MEWLKVEVADKLQIVINKVAGAASKALAKTFPKLKGDMKSADDYKGLAGKVESWTSDGGKVDHRMWATVRNGKGEVWIDSGKQTLTQQIGTWEKNVKNLSGTDQANFKNAIQVVKNGQSELKLALNAVSDKTRELKVATDESKRARDVAEKARTPAERK